MNNFCFTHFLWSLRLQNALLSSHSIVGDDSSAISLASGMDMSLVFVWSIPVSKKRLSYSEHFWDTKVSSINLTIASFWAGVRVPLRERMKEKELESITKSVLIFTVFYLQI